ncbi:MAG: S8 family serine peptidase [Sedimentibacter sp.]|uniref:S8 family serine peptidase n=1 Tax=Sedimentibacter sp. TaxID=1960295 RepID=UPI0031597107
MSLSNKNMTGYTTLSGTSMSAPMVSGAAALLLNENPNYTHYDIKRKLLNACTKIKASSLEQGAGILDISRIFSKDNKRECLAFPFVILYLTNFTHIDNT